MGIDVGFILAMAGTIVGGIVWAVRLEGRVNAHQTLFEEREKLTIQRHADLQARLIRIEQKLDRANGNGGAYSA